jgi:3-hydroxyisobutyrate dehydrogenase
VPTTVFDLDRAAVDDMVLRGARPAASLAELAGTARVVGVCVPADNHVRAVLAGDDGLLAHLPAGAVVAIHSTVLPETVRWAADAAAERDIGVVEAPVTGRAAAAEQGRSTFLLAGAPEHVAAIEPILAACGDVRVHLDELGDASRLKLCINLQTRHHRQNVNGISTSAQASQAQHRSGKRQATQHLSCVGTRTVSCERG